MIVFFPSSVLLFYFECLSTLLFSDYNTDCVKSQLGNVNREKGKLIQVQMSKNHRQKKQQASLQYSPLTRQIANEHDGVTFFKKCIKDCITTLDKSVPIRSHDKQTRFNPALSGILFLSLFLDDLAHD